MCSSHQVIDMIDKEAPRDDIIEFMKNISDLSVYQADELAERIVKIDDDFIKANIVTLLGKYGSDRHIQYLIPLLNSEDHRIRANTIEALEALGDMQTVNSVIRLLQDSSRRVRTNVIKFLQNKMDLNFDYLEKDFISCPKCKNPMICAFCTNIEEETQVAHGLEIEEGQTGPKPEPKREMELEPELEPGPEMEPELELELEVENEPVIAPESVEEEEMNLDDQEPSIEEEAQASSKAPESRTKETIDEEAALLADIERMMSDNSSFGDGNILQSVAEIAPEIMAAVTLPEPEIEIIQVAHKVEKEVLTQATDELEIKEKAQEAPEMKEEAIDEEAALLADIERMMAEEGITTEELEKNGIILNDSSGQEFQKKSPRIVQESFVDNGDLAQVATQLEIKEKAQEALGIEKEVLAQAAATQLEIEKEGQGPPVAQMPPEPEIQEEVLPENEDAAFLMDIEKLLGG